MRNWQVSDLDINVDSVLRGQGADPKSIRKRSPRLVEVAARALDMAITLVEPKVTWKQVGVKSLKHEKLELEDGTLLRGPLVSQHLVGADAVMAVLCTVGSKIDQHATETMAADMVLGLAIDGVGSAAVEALANAFCRTNEIEAEAKGLKTTMPLSPGMIGWSVEEGQPVIFDLLESSEIGIELTPHKIMVPRKSLSMLIGVGTGLGEQASTCDYCAMKETCQYQDHYQQAQNG
jgi:hypothetical protein